MTDRTVHAFLGKIEVVRYDRAGAWWIEMPNERRRVSLEAAVSCALDLFRDRGTILLGKPGGMIFDSKVRRRWSAIR